MSWAVVGIAFELIGLLIALAGLDRLGDELFPGSPLPHRAAWQRGARSVKGRLGIRPKPITVQVGSAIATGTVPSPRVVTTARRPSDAEPQAAWNAYWDSRLENLSDDIAALEQYVKEADDGLAKRLKTEAAERREGHVQLEEQLKRVVGGEGGSGLVLTWSGLVVTACGILLQGLAEGLG